MATTLGSRTRTRVLCLLVFLTACQAPFQRRDWSSYTGPGREHFLKEEVPFIEIRDPIEPVNRVLAGANYALLRYGLAPLGRVYRFIVPPPLRTGLENVGDNLRYPRRLVNNLLQGKWSDSWNETRRFAANTTLGMAGLYDPATEIWQIPASNEDFGQTFARAGWRDSTYLFLPFLGPSTIRDGLGKVGDAAFSPLTYVPFASVADRFNDLSDEFEGLLRAVHSNYDAYQLGRVLYVLTREVDATDFSWKSDSTGEVETLAAVFLAPEDPGFPGRGETHTVTLFDDERRLPYSAWMQPEPATVVYLLPGLGAHRIGESSLGLAEAAYDFGASVVTLSSAMNFEFMKGGASTALPGFLPRDAADVHRALGAIHADLERRYPGHAEGQSRFLFGVSLGGAHTLTISATAQDPDDDGLKFDLYVALDPPVDLRYAAGQLDRFYNAPLGFPATERAERMEEILAKVLELAEGRMEPTMDLPFTRLEAEYLIGLSFRATLQMVLLASQERHDQGILLTPRDPLRMAPAFREASEYSFMEYLYGFLLPYYAEQIPEVTLDDAGAAWIFERSDLRSLEPSLRSNERVRVFANANDFLLGPDDRTWLQSVLGERAFFFDEGGHLGNLHRDAVQEVIRSIVVQANEEVAPVEN